MQDLLNAVEVDTSYRAFVDKIEAYGLKLGLQEINSIYQKFQEKRISKKFIPVDQLMEITIMESMN